MDVLTKGTPSRLEDVPNGECFAFEVGDHTAVGIKIAYPQSPQSQILVLRPSHSQPPALQSKQEAKPTIVYLQPAMAISTGIRASRLRDGVGIPQPGQIMQFKEDVYIGFLDEHTDPSSVSLKTGLINPNRINGPAAIFENWEIVFNTGAEPAVIFRYPPSRSS